MTTPTEKPQGAAALPERVWIEWNELASGTTPTCLSDEEQFGRKKPGADHNLRYLSLAEHQEILDAAVKAARAEARAEAIGEALDLIDRDQGNGILLCVTLDELRDLSDAAREKTV